MSIEFKKFLEQAERKCLADTEVRDRRREVKHLKKSIFFAYLYLSGNCPVSLSLR